MKVALIPCGTTDWREKGRLLGRVELEPNPGAAAKYGEWSESLRALALRRLFHAPDGLSTATAEGMGRLLEIPAKAIDDLVEIDLGLWAGLTEAELKKRFSKAYRQLEDSPLTVSPPRGEDFAVAAERLRSCVKKRIKPNGKADIGLVVRPLTFAILRHILEGGDPSGIWETSQRETDPLVVEVSGLAQPVGNAG